MLELAQCHVTALGGPRSGPRARLSLDFLFLVQRVVVDSEQELEFCTLYTIKSYTHIQTWRKHLKKKQNKTKQKNVLQDSKWMTEIILLNVLWLWPRQGQIFPVDRISKKRLNINQNSPWNHYWILAKNGRYTSIIKLQRRQRATLTIVDEACKW